MSTEITARNFEITDDIRELITSRLARVEDRLFDDVIETRVVLDVQKYRNICEIMITGRDHDVKVVQESDQSMTDAIHAALDHARRQARKNRERLRDHHRNDGVPLTGEGEAPPA